MTSTFPVFLLLLSFFSSASSVSSQLVDSRNSNATYFVTDSQGFHDAFTNESLNVLLLIGDVELRNYYGWITPSTDVGKSQASGTLEISSANEDSISRPKCDLDGRSLHSLLEKHDVLITKSVHFTKVECIPSPELKDIKNRTIQMENCIVEVFIKGRARGTIGARWRNFKSLVHDPSSLRNVGLRVTDWWCVRNLGISCKHGAVMIDDSNVQWTPSYTWSARKTLIKFVHKDEYTVSIPSAFSLAIERMKNFIYIPHDLALNFEACKDTEIVTNTTIMDPARSMPPSLVVNFQERLYGCLPVDGSLTVRIADFILRNVFSAEGWPDVFPFVHADAGATIILENVIIEMDANSSFAQKELKKMVRSIRHRDRPLSLGEGQQKLDVWRKKDCTAYLEQSRSCQIQKKCPKEAECPSGAIFIEDAAFVIKKGDGNDDLNIGVEYHIRHSLITVVRNEVPSFGEKKVADQSEASDFASESEKKVHTTSRSLPIQVMMVVLFIVIGVMCILLLICGFVTYRHGFLSRLGTRRTSSRRVGARVGSGIQREVQMLRPASVNPEMEIPYVMDPARLVAGVPKDALAAKELESYQNYQQTANKLLGSVTLGPLLGAGSFGKVFKATWNGASVAVKVVVHDGLSYLGASAQREALLSTDLHHPNIVQTFLQTTREIKANNSIPVPRTPDQASTSKTQQATNPTTVESMDNCAERLGEVAGYFNLNDLANNDENQRAPLPDPFGEASEYSDDGESEGNDVGDRVETWMVQEFCDMGSLEKAIRKRKFMQGNDLDMLSVVETCVDICRGMIYLNTRNIIHGDLKSSNILLNGSLSEEKGYVAKVADFGLSRELGNHASHIKTQTTGTVTHMPPELFKEEKMTAASDVYSFGIVMWELVSKESPLEGVPHVLIIKKIVYDSWRPTFSAGTPSCYIALAQSCWSEDSDQRPSIQQVLIELEEMRKIFLDEYPLSSNEEI